MSLDELKSAVRAGNLELLRKLLPSDPPSSDSTTLSDLLLLACVNGQEDIVTFLIQEKGVDVNYLPYGGKTPLMQAVEGGQVTVVKQLIDKYHANVNLKNSSESSALEIACKEGKSEIVEILFAHSGQKSDEESMHSLLKMTVELGHVEVASCLLQNGAKVINEKTKSNILNIACKKGNVTMVEVLLEKGGSDQVNYIESDSGLSPLMTAIDDRHYEIVKLLLKYNAAVNDVDKKGYFPLIYAILRNSPNVVTLLLKHGANVNQICKQQLTGQVLCRGPLIFALNTWFSPHTEPKVNSRAIDVVKALLDGGADVNMEDNYKGTALSAIVKAGPLEIIKLLIDKGAHIDHQNNQGESPLILAASAINYDSSKILLEEGANVNLPDKWNQTPLIVAASVNPFIHRDAQLRANIMQLYLDKGANIDGQDNEGNYALLCALKGQNFEASDCLLKEGANAYLNSDDGKSAAKFLQEESNLSFEKDLIEMNAELWQRRDDRMTIQCAVCEEDVRFYGLKDTIICKGASCNGQPIHMQCAGLSRKTLEHASKSDFMCPKCELSSLKDEVASMKQSFLSLKEEVAAMKPNSMSKESTSVHSSKKFSIIVQGIEECEAYTAMSICLKEDLAKVISVLSKVDGSVQTQAIRDCHRLGKYDQARQRPRPILVQFLRSADVSSILSKTSAVESPYSIQHYMTPTELARNKILLKKRWAIHTETGTDLKLIKIHKDSIIVEGRLHGTLNTTTNQYDTSPDLRGINTLHTTKIEVTNSSQSFYWKEYGLKLNIPAQSLPDDIKTCKITITVSLSGQYKFPEGTELVSPVFCLICEPYCKFTHPLRLEIEHCALPENSSHLSMARAFCTQKDLPYSFEKLDNGSFSKSTKHGAIALNSFSIFAVIQNLFKSRRYWYDVFDIIPSFRAKDIHFAITWDDSAHIKNVKDYYTSLEARSRNIGQPITFQQDRISLDIPDEGITSGGWKIYPDFPPIIKKTNVDQSASISHCVLKARWQRHGLEVEPLEAQRIYILGTNQENNFFTIDSPAQAVVTTENRSSHPEVVPPPSPLTERDQPKIRQYLSQLGNQELIEVGVSLGLSSTWLNRRSSSDSLLNDMVISWLRRDGNVLQQSGPPSWESLCRALEECHYNGIASDIRRNEVN